MLSMGNLKKKYFKEQFTTAIKNEIHSYKFKHVRDLYAKNYKTLIKKSKTYFKGECLIFIRWKIQYC